MQKSENLQLNLITNNLEDSAMTFQEYREKVSGTSGDSNMQIIDQAFGDLSSDIAQVDEDLSKDIEDVAKDVSDLKSALAQSDLASVNAVVVLPVEWEQGSLSQDSETQSTIRVRTGFIFVKNLSSLSLSTDDGYQMAVDYYDQSKTWKREQVFAGGSRTITPSDIEEYYVRLILRNAPPNATSAIVPATAQEHTTITVIPEIKALDDTIARIDTRLATAETQIETVQSAQAVSNNAITKLNLTLENQINNCVVKGSIANDGTDDNGVNISKIRIRTTDIVDVKAGTIIICSDDVYGIHPYYFYVIEYNNDGSVKSYSGPVNFYQFSADTRVRLTGRDGNNVAFTDETIAGWQNSLRVISGICNHYYSHIKDGVRSINHAGFPPINTIPGFINAYNAGFRIQEFDNRVTADGVWVCCHNATINATARNADGSAISSDIAVSETNYSDLLQYDFGIYAGNKYAGTKISKTEEVLLFLKSIGSEAYIDIASYPDITQEQIIDLVKIVKSVGMLEQAFFLCTGELGGMNYCKWICEFEPRANVILVGTYTRYGKCAILSQTGLNAVALDARQDLASSTEIENAKVVGLPYEVYDVSTTEQIDALDDYITGISADAIIASDYLKSKSGVQQYNAPLIIQSRAENVINGYLIDNGKAVISCAFDSLYTASDSPQMLSAFPAPDNGSAVLQCVEYDSLNETVKSCGAVIAKSNGVLILSSVTNGKHYIITGEYEMA